MTKITEHIRNRRSVRNYDGRRLEDNIIEQLLSFGENLDNPFGIDVDIKFLDAKEHGLVCPMANGTDIFVGGKIKYVPMANVAFGYSFEKFILFAQSLGVGTVWLGGTMNRPAFEEAMNLAEDEIMPCASPLGYAAKKMSIKEIMMRKAIKADERMDFEELFFDGGADKPLSRERAGQYADVLDMVRLAPSAVNKQPWRVIMLDNAFHFYLKRSKGFDHISKLDMQQVDMGIALCHFALAAKEKGISIQFLMEDPELAVDSGLEYIASYALGQLD